MNWETLDRWVFYYELILFFCFSFSSVSFNFMCYSVKVIKFPFFELVSDEICIDFYTICSSDYFFNWIFPAVRLILNNKKKRFSFHEFLLFLLRIPSASFPFSYFILLNINFISRIWIDFTFPNSNFSMYIYPYRQLNHLILHPSNCHYFLLFPFLSFLFFCLLLPFRDCKEYSHLLESIKPCMRSWQGLYVHFHSFFYRSFYFCHCIILHLFIYSSIYLFI